jgi:hypothetical protein
VRRDLGLALESARVGDPPVRIFRDPFQRLPAVTGNEHRHGSDRLGYEIRGPGQRAVGRLELRELLGEDGAHDAQLVAEQGGTLFKVDAEGRKLDRPVARGNAEDQAVAREPVDR